MNAFGFAGPTHSTVGDVRTLAVIVHVLGADAARAVAAEMPLLDREEAIGWAVELAATFRPAVRH